MWTEKLIDLNYRLAALYPQKEDITMIAEQSGLSLDNIAIENKSFRYWFNVIRAARAENKLDQLLERVMMDYTEDQALKDIASHLLDEAGEINLPVQKQFCLDLVEMEEVYECIPLLIDATEKADISFSKEVELMNECANYVGALEEVAGQANTKQTRNLNRLKNQLILSIQSL